MRVIITGGTGLIGRALGGSLVADGHKAIVLSRSPEKAAGLADGVSVEGWDARSAGEWASLVDGAGAVVNLAGASIAGESFFPTRWTTARKKLILESRLDAGRAIVQAVEAAAQKPGVLIQSSAIGYYGPHGDEKLDEASAASDDYLGATAEAWEESTAAVEAMGVRRVVVRTGVVLSGEDGALPRLLLPFKLFAGGPMGNGKQWLSWIHVDDLVKAIRFLMDNPQASGAFNLTAPNPVTNAELAHAIGRVMRRPSFIPVPGPAMRLAFGEVATTVLDGQRVMPRRLQEAGYEFLYSEVEPALREILA